MPYLIDGNNLLGAGRDRRLGLPTKERDLVAALSSFAAARRTRITIVFDGPARPHARAGLQVVYSGRRAADDVIAERVRSSRTPRDLIVVTSDRDLRSRVQAASGRVMGCREFADTLAAARERGGAEEKPDAADVVMWERYFAGED